MYIFLDKKIYTFVSWILQYLKSNLIYQDLWLYEFLWGYFDNVINIYYQIYYVVVMKSNK